MVSAPPARCLRHCLTSATTTTATRSFVRGLACTPPTAAPATTTPSLLRCTRVTSRVAAPRLHPTTRATTTTARAALRLHHVPDRTTPTRRHASPTPTPMRPTRLNGGHFLGSPTAGALGGLLGGTTTVTAGGFSGAARAAQHAVLSCDDGPDTPAEGDCSLDLGPLGVELTDADVLVGDIHLPVPVAVRLGPRLRLADRPRVATEEKRLDVHWLARLRDRTRSPRNCRRTRRSWIRARETTLDRPCWCDWPSMSNTTTASLFAECGQALVIKAHVTVDRQPPSTHLHASRNASHIVETDHEKRAFERNYARPLAFNETAARTIVYAKDRAVESRLGNPERLRASRSAIRHAFGRQSSD